MVRLKDGMFGGWTFERSDLFAGEMSLLAGEVTYTIG